ncbi:DUF4261 domain-containing protein [Hyalangium rubrum]|uniref:DUF4261 domain-containing protein n=1 Tax=Hyalangium rubrum TaxID=3103134 RepID=A0ABU5H265_9BACT|nr:DUF4261 domain-containing protein [Hyalangium sp. s54d21]MDY7227475.1 DUF4261 domain-containing protein [Hyalangium sp. s54d21]
MGEERDSPLSLQLLFPGKVRLNINTLTSALVGFHPSLAGVEFRLEARASEVMDAEVSTARWSRHTVQGVVFNRPMPAAIVESCVAPAHYGAPLKAQARAHQSHALLFYKGEEKDPLEQYVALGLVAVALATEGALVVLNESAHTSFPAQPLVPGPGEDVLELLRTMPLTALYVGFVKLEVEGVGGVWMRTYGASRMGLPDLAWHARSHEEAREAFELFSGLLEYLRSTGARFMDGHTAEWEGRQVRIRKPGSEETFLDASGELFVLEPR